MRKPERRLGDLLVRQRAATGWSVAEITRDTDLSAQFVHDLESGRYEHLPPDVYTLHGVKQYARALGLDEQETKRQYMEERGKVATVSFHRSRRNPSPIVTSSLVLRGVVAAVAFMVVGYVLYQVAIAAAKPSLEVVFPRENQIIYTNEVELVGQTEPDNTVAIDGRQITVAKDGSFRYTLALPEGRHRVNVLAENDFGRTSRITRHFIIDADLD